MPFSGSAPNKTYGRTDGTRTGTQVWQQAKAAPVKIRADNHDTHDQDLADAISSLWLRDGGNQPTADLPLNSFKFTGVGNAAARTQFASAAQIQDGGVIYAATSSNDTITAALTPAVTAYVAGQLLLAKIGGTNTGAATINYNTVGAASIKKGKSGSLAMSAGDLAAGRMALLAHDGTNFQDLTAPEFPSGTVMLFQQTAAPPGWTKGATHDNKALRVVTGAASSGGSTAFTTVFASRTPAGTVGATTLDVTQIPSHTHFEFNGDSTTVLITPSLSPAQTRSTGGSGDYNITGTANTPDRGISGPAGGGASHTHSFAGTAMDFAVQYVDVILATKD